MADAYLKPILDAIETIAKANLNTKKNLIDSTVPSIDATAYGTARQPMPERYPWFETYPFGDSPINSEYETGGTFQASWQIATSIYIVANNLHELQEYADVWLTSLIRALTAGSTGNIWTFNQTSEIVRLIRVGWRPLEGEEQGTITGACGAIWEADSIYDPTNE